MWYADGKAKYRTNKYVPFKQPMHLIVQLAVGGNWPGNPDETTVFPCSLDIDYIRAYQKENTAAPVYPPK